MAATPTPNSKPFKRHHWGKWERMSPHIPAALMTFTHIRHCKRCGKEQVK